jgi:endonuclease YncB( thermonuclease family)
MVLVESLIAVIAIRTTVLFLRDDTPDDATPHGGGESVTTRDFVERNGGGIVPKDAETVRVTVERVIDGDTLHVRLFGGEELRVRLFGASIPELDDSVARDRRGTAVGRRSPRRRRRAGAALCVHASRALDRDERIENRAVLPPGGDQTIVD